MKGNERSEGNERREYKNKRRVGVFCRLGTQLYGKKPRKEEDGGVAAVALLAF
jgi:hypothetical protein